MPERMSSAALLLFVTQFIVSGKHPHQLCARAGFDWCDDEQNHAEDTRNISVEPDLYHRYYIRERGTWTTDIVYNPLFEHELNIRSCTKVSWNCHLTSRGLSIEMGVHGLHNTHTPGPTEHCNANYFGRIK